MRDEEMKKIIRREIDTEFSDLHSCASLESAIMSRIEGEKSARRHVPATLVFAVMMVLALGSMAVAAGLGLFGQLRTGKAPTAAQLQLFHDRLYAATRARIPDRRALLFRMKEAWRYLGCSFADAERPLRRIRKAQDMIEYESAVRQLFASCPVREDAGYRV